MSCRIANDHDIPMIANLKYRMFQEVHMAHLLSDHFIEDVVESYRGLYSKGNAQHFVIEDNQCIIACAGAFIKDDIPYCFYKESKYGFIGDVYVEPKYRQKGYARELTDTALNWFNNYGIKTVRLLASHNARHLYESIGFKGTDEMVLHF